MKEKWKVFLVVCLTSWNNCKLIFFLLISLRKREREKNRQKEENEKKEKQNAKIIIPQSCNIFSKFLLDFTVSLQSFCSCCCECSQLEVFFSCRSLTGTPWERFLSEFDYTFRFAKLKCVLREEGRWKRRWISYILKASYKYNINNSNKVLISYEIDVLSLLRLWMLWNENESNLPSF